MIVVYDARFFDDVRLDGRFAPELRIATSSSR